MTVLEKIMQACSGRLDVAFEGKGDDTVAVVNVPSHVTLSTEEWRQPATIGIWPVRFRRNGVDPTVETVETTPGAPPWFSVQNVPSTATSAILWRPDDETMAVLKRIAHALENLIVRASP